MPSDRSAKSASVVPTVVVAMIVTQYQYLRQKSGCFSVDSADFGGLENPVVD